MNRQKKDGITQRGLYWKFYDKTRIKNVLNCFRFRPIGRSRDNGVDVVMKERAIPSELTPMKATDFNEWAETFKYTIDHDEPLVTVIIPYKHDRGWLQQAISSVQSQNYQRIELILACNNKNVSANLNDGIRRAKGSLIRYLSDDDYLAPDSIKNSVNAMKDFDATHGIALEFNSITGDSVFYDPPIKEPTLADMLELNQINGGTVMYRADVFERFGMFDETLDCAEELDMHLRILKGGGKIGYCETLLYFYRRHPLQKSLGSGVDQKARQLKIQMIRDRYK